MELRSRMIDIPANMMVLHISGRINLNNLGPLESEFESMTKGVPVKLILDLQKVEAIDSQGIGVLIKARNDIVAQGGRVVLTGLNNRISTVLKISGLLDYFVVAPTEFQAIKLLEEK